MYICNFVYKRYTKSIPLPTDFNSMIYCILFVYFMLYTFCIQVFLFTLPKFMELGVYFYNTKSILRER